MRMLIKGKLKPSRPFEIHFQDSVIPVFDDYDLEPYPGRRCLRWTWIDGSECFATYPGTTDNLEWHIVIDSQTICTRYLIFPTLMDQIFKCSKTRAEWNFGDEKKFNEQQRGLTCSILDLAGKRLISWRTGLFDGSSDVVYNMRHGEKFIAIYAGMVLAQSWGLGRRWAD